MLVISNGAMKCGSTWLANILMLIVQPKSIPRQYQDSRFVTLPTILPERLEDFLEEVDYENVNYVSKNHFFYEKYLLDRFDNIYVVDISRNMADAVVSYYFHAKKKLDEWDQTDPHMENISDGYWKYGPEFVKSITRYRSIWSKEGSRSYTASYETLKEFPCDEIRNISKFLGVPLTEDRIEEIANETTFERMSKLKFPVNSGMDSRFRKGVVGDHLNHLDESIIKDIKRIEEENIGYPKTVEEEEEFLLESQQHNENLKKGKTTGVESEAASSQS